MAYEVLARRWRPQQFSDVVGQAHVTRTLENAIAGDRVAHAYLFVGPRGTGKTTTARILAKCLNCEKGPTAKPCDKCDSCREIMAGNHLDVLEYDAASNTQVDKMREILDAVYFAPAKGPFKIYVIDEVHMLSQGSFNALLKTLEEPPGHVKFIFATTEPQKVPATILSRCQRFDLRRIDAQDIVGRLEEIAQEEGIKIDERALAAIARGAEGGMRDAQSALDQLIAFQGKDISEEDVLSVFGLVSGETLNKLVSAMLKGNVGDVLKSVADLDRVGKDLHRLVQELIGLFRDLLVCFYTDGSRSLLDVPDTQAEMLKALAADTDPGKVFRIVEILTETEARIRYALSRKVLLETSLIQACRAASMASMDQVIHQLNELKLQLGEAPSAGAPPQDEKKKPEAQALIQDPPPSKPAPGGELAVLLGGWPSLKERAFAAAPLTRSCLADAVPVSLDAGKLVLGVSDPGAPALKNARNLKALQHIFGSFLGSTIRLKFVPLAGSNLPSVEEVKEETAAEAKPGSVEDLRKNPLVRKAMEMFNGDVTQRPD